MMATKNYLLLLLLFIYASTNAQSLTVELKNLKFIQGGTIYLMVIDKNDKPVREIKRPTSENNAVFVFNNLPAALYAVRVFHDKNNNGKIDTGFFGQPIEGWGVSNDARGFMSAPPFNKMLLNITGDMQTNIKIEYW